MKALPLLRPSRHLALSFRQPASLFFSFMILLTLDDDLVDVPRKKNPSFKAIPCNKIPKTWSIIFEMSLQDKPVCRKIVFTLDPCL
jgi:hypothetical protein